jgi:hypothetical protein
MGNARFCATCGSIIGGWDQTVDDDCQCITGISDDGYVIDVDRAVEYIIEQFDFAVDAIVESRRYVSNAFWSYSKVRQFDLSPFNKARIALVTARLEEEIEYFVNGESEDGDGEEENE